MPCAMHTLLIPLLVACVGDRGPTVPAEPLPDGWSDPGIHETGASPALQLHRLVGRYDLPPQTVPDDHDPGRRFDVPLTQERRRRHRGKLPFDVGSEGRRFAPPGMRVYHGDQALPYGKGNPHWSIGGNDNLVVMSGTPLDKVQVAWEGVQAAVDRHQFSRAGLSPEEFVRYSLTLNDHTRDGLLLPAPATAEWDVTLPAGGATFESWVALEPPIIASDRSDGAMAVLTVIDGGTETEVAQHRLRGPSRDFARWTVDLSRWEGKQVTLRLSSVNVGSPWFDYVFLGSPTVWGPPEGPVRRVVVIGLDTTRPDHLSFYGYHRETTPEFDRILGQSAVFTQAYTPAPRTRPSFRSATTGRNPLEAVGAKNIGAVFQENGFATAAIVSNVHLQPRFGFHEGFDSWLYESGVDAKEQVDRGLQWLQDHKDRDSYLFLHIMDPHIFYNAPGSFRDRFVEDPDPDLPPRFNRWQVYKMAADGELTERRKKHIEALYDGELAYMSVHLARFFDGLDRLGGNTLVVIHSDHGEEFWEHGGFEHNHNLYRETTDAVLAFRPGRGMASPLRIDTPATLADIAPTLYDFAGFTHLPPLDGRSLRPLLEGKGGEGWDRPIGVAHLRYGAEQWGVVHQRHKYIIHTGTGQEELYDLEADPSEQRNLVGERDLVPFHQALAEAHGMGIGEGWRVFVDVMPGSAPFVFELPEAPRDAGIIDPERTTSSPNNQAWGEPPSRVPEEIGETTLVGATFTWTPGHSPRQGVLYALFGKTLDPTTVQITRDGEELSLLPQPDGSVLWQSGRERLQVSPGVVVIPPPGEAQRIAALEGGTVEATDDQMALLRALGYVGGGEGDDSEDGQDR